MTGVTVVDHPLVARHLSVLRDRATPSSDFRRRLSDVSMLLLYEALRDLRVREDQIETPLETTGGMRLADEIVVIAILRAGLGMTDGALRLIPEARVGHLGLYRDEESLQPVGYYESIPQHAADAELVVVDPMLATGGSAVARVRPAQARRQRAAALRLPRRRARGRRGDAEGASRGPDLVRDDRPPARRARLHPPRAGRRRRPGLRDGVAPAAAGGLDPPPLRYAAAPAYCAGEAPISALKSRMKCAWSK